MLLCCVSRFCLREASRRSNMIFTPSDFSVAVQVPATTANLGPGFDSLGLALGLYNRLELRVSDADSLQVSGEGEAELLGAKTTIAHTAAKQIFTALGHEIAGVHLTLENSIPLSRGLGSSSAAIVASMVAANQWCHVQTGKSFEPSRILEFASHLEGHPDNVAPALLGGFVVAAMAENGAVHAIKVPVKEWPRFVAFIPETELSTKFARGVLPENYSRADAVFNLSRAALLVAALGSGDFEALRESLQDKIHQPFRAPHVPGWNEATHAAHEAGAIGVTLSGAGPTTLAWTTSENNEAVRDAIQTAVTTANIAGRVIVLDAIESGGTVIES
jgi:homoserine kinase